MSNQTTNPSFFQAKQQYLQSNPILFQESDKLEIQSYKPQQNFSTSSNEAAGTSYIAVEGAGNRKPNLISQNSSSPLYNQTHQQTSQKYQQHQMYHHQQRNPQYQLSNFSNSGYPESN